jgi:ATP synthase protein I
MKPDDPKANDLEGRIAKARAAGERHGSAAPGGGEDPGIESAMNFGLRAGSQFVSAVVVGGGLGWAIDRWLGTKPFAMLILMVLMFIAAMANVWRSMSKAVDVATEAALASEKAAAAGDRATEEIDGKSS